MTPTAIEWTEETWNPVTGCTKVSAGCDHCYAERITERFGGKGSFSEIKLHPERVWKPLHWRKPRTVFVNSMSDLFHAEVPREFIAQVFAVMAATSRHTYQILTKRPGRARALLRDEKFLNLIAMGFSLFDEIPADAHWPGWPLPNVWLGTSVEDQDSADKRVGVLLDAPAAIHFLSCEPLLGPVSLRPWLHKLGWVIVGGESGPESRPMDIAWVRAIRDECVAAEVNFFFKQVGGRTPKANGRDLDGRTWDEMPKASVVSQSAGARI